MMYTVFSWELSRAAAAAGEAELRKMRIKFKEDIQQLQLNLPFPQLREIWLRVLNTAHLVGPLSDDEKKLIAKGFFNPVTETMRFTAQEMKDLKRTKRNLVSIIEGNIALSLEMIRDDSFLHKIMYMPRWVSPASLAEKSSRMCQTAVKLEKHLGQNPNVDIRDEFKSLISNDVDAYASFFKKHGKQFPNITKYLTEKLGYRVEVNPVPAPRA